MSKEKKILTAASMLVCFILIFVYCLSPLHLGINSGGMNSELEASVGLSGINDGHFYIKYNITNNCDAEYGLGSYASFIRLIVSIADNFTDVFDIRIISFIYLILLMVSVFYLNKYINLGTLNGNIIFAVVTLLIYFDLSYLLYINTLYAESAFYVFFVLALSLYVKLVCSPKPQLPTTVFFFILSVIICGLKPDMAILAIPLAAMGIYLLIKRKGYAYRAFIILFTLVLLVYPGLRYKNYPNVEQGKFDSVFYGALYENDNPEKSLKKLGIPEKYSELAGKNTYEQLPEYVYNTDFRNEFFNKISSGRLMAYYLLNPKEYVSKYKYVGFNALETYPKYAGNYTLDSGKTANEKAGGFKLYNILKEKVFPKTLWFIYLIPILTAVLLIGYRSKIKNMGLIILGISVSAMSLILFNIPMLNYGLVDISRTMAMFNVAFDTVIIILISVFIYVTSQRKQEFKDKYGLSQ